MTTPFWLTAFLDLPEHTHEAGSRFWSSVTGWPVSASRGDEGEFTTLVPGKGDPHLKIQRTRATTPGTHLDLHVTNPDAGLDRALSLGGALVERSRHGFIVARSPGGYTFCLVRERLGVPATATLRPAGDMSIVDQLCLDIPASSFDAETTFWASLTGWECHQSAVRREFAFLHRPPGVAVRLLLQRLDVRDGPVGGHVDLATTDRAAEARLHEFLGATREPVQAGIHWTVMRDPTGAAYCITDRDPQTGLLA